MSVTMETPFAKSPAEEHPEEIYSNFDHWLDKDTMSEIAHNQAMFARHSAQNYNSRVYAVTYDGELWWYEEVWRFHAPVTTYRGQDLEQLIQEVIYDFGGE